MKHVTDKSEIITKLEKYFSGRPDVSMVFLFGSYAKDRTHAESDIDIAVYIKSSNGIEVESESRYECEDDIWSDVEKLVGREVDLLVLNRASSCVCDVAVRTGIPIIVKDRRVFFWYLLTVSDLAEEFRNYIFDLWRIKNAYRRR